MTGNPQEPSQALATLLHVRSNSLTLDGIGDLDGCARDLGAACMAIRLFDATCEPADLVLFADGSAFFAETEGGSYLPFPFDYRWQAAEEVPPGEIGAADAGLAALCDVAGLRGERIEECEIEDRQSFEARMREMAEASSDPPEALRGLIVDSSRDLAWASPTEAQEARKLVLLFAQNYLPEAFELAIHADCREGRPPTQIREDTTMMEFLVEHAPVAIHREEVRAMYESRAYAEILDASGVDAGEIARFNAVLVFFSERVLATIGQPTGWETDYNDGHRSRVSGYSARPATVDFDVEALSNHERIAAGATLGQFLAREGWLREMNTQLAANGFSPLGAGRQDETDRPEEGARGDHGPVGKASPGDLQ